MKIPGLGLLREFGQVRAFNALSLEERAIVFYAEDTASRVHFEPILRELTGPMDRRVCYLTSVNGDPILGERNTNIQAFAIGEGTARTNLFTMLKAGVLVMTMPGLDVSFIKRTQFHPVHYLYVFHSIVSTHMIYQKAAFDYYDTILTVGPHHAEEIRATENLYGLPQKTLIEHGYGRLDALIEDRSSDANEHRSGDQDQLRVLVAPSWGSTGLIETLGEALIDVLTEAGFHTTLRPHPITVKNSPQVMSKIRERFGGHPGFVIETDIASQESLHRSDLMISDWSGAALEYAFAEERPVLFVDVERKVNNPEYQRIEVEPIEVSVRGEIGEVADPSDLRAFPSLIRQMCKDVDRYVDRIRRVRERTVFNIGASGREAARAIARIADDLGGPG